MYMYIWLLHYVYSLELNMQLPTNPTGATASAEPVRRNCIHVYTRSDFIKNRSAGWTLSKACTVTEFMKLVIFFWIPTVFCELPLFIHNVNVLYIIILSYCIYFCDGSYMYVYMYMRVCIYMYMRILPDYEIRIPHPHSSRNLLLFHYLYTKIAMGAILVPISIPFTMLMHPSCVKQ